MQIALSSPEVKVYGSRTVDTELKFCRSALDRCSVLAMQGQLESATRGVWAVKDAADSVKRLLAKGEVADGLDHMIIQLNEVQKGLNDLTRYLDIPPEAH